MKQGDIYKHKKTGKLYSIVSDDFKVKEFKETVRLTMPDSFDDEWINKYEWKEGLILYKAEYDCPGCPFFARYPEDFYKEFELANPESDDKKAESQLYKKFFTPEQRRHLR